MSAWMTHAQAMACAHEEARGTGYRHRVHKSRALIGWWTVAQLPELVPPCQPPAPATSDTP